VIFKFCSFLHFDDYFSKDTDTEVSSTKNEDNHGPGWSDYLLAFYILISISIVYIMTFLFVGIAFKSKWKFDWAVSFLKFLTRVNQSVLFLPLIKMFLSMMNCSNGYHYIYTTQKCWSGLHFFHAIMAVLVIFFFGYLSILVAITYY
jgi:hypothetical protein